MRTLAAALLPLLVACAADVAPAPAPAAPAPGPVIVSETGAALAALSVWQGPAGDCAERARDLVSEIEPDELKRRERCGVPDGAKVTLLGGCYIEGYDTIVRRDVQSTRAHEITHWLYDCSGLGTDQSNHGDVLFWPTVDKLMQLMGW